MLAIASIAPTPALCDIADMAGEGLKSLYEALMAVKPDGLSPNAWAVKAGVNRTIFSDVRNRNNIRQDTLEKLLEAIGVSLAEFDAARRDDGGSALAGFRARSEVAPAGLSDPLGAKYGEEALPLVPLLGTAMAGEFDPKRHIEMTELDLGEILDHIRRPLSLRGDQAAYAVTIVGDSMFPRFRPGRQVIVSPRAPASIGDDVIVQLLGEEDDFGERRVVQVLIKELIRRTGKHIELRQYNPDVTFRVDLDRVAAVHKVMGELF